MKDILKKHGKQTIDIYELALAYVGKATLLWSQKEVEDFIAQLVFLAEENVIQIKRSAKGAADLGFIHRRIKINQHTLLEGRMGVRLHLFRHDLGMDASYYLKHTAQYDRDEQHLERLVKFLEEDMAEMTLCEISYDIFHDEKAITQPKEASVDGRLILQRAGLDWKNLAYVETIPPFYYPITVDGDVVLVVENKDTCFSLVRLLRERKSNIKGVIFGEGWAVIKIFKFLYLYDLGERDTFLYYGDIDQEGFDIARTLMQGYPRLDIKLSQVLYHSLLPFHRRSLYKKREIDSTKVPEIVTSLSDQDQQLIMTIIKEEQCIPQEALNYKEMKVIMDEVQYKLY